ncbi:MAG: HAMP domain-containing histidine kinase [Planctomycetes bacterium]|nr:HAMP domain-containing histidine kinase [Planctomycetota bacterium]
MSSRPARTGLWFALTLALPAAFAGAWVWLVPGGVIDRMAASERRTADQALATALQRLDHELAVAAAQQPVPLQLDDSRRVRGPFPLPRSTDDGWPTASVAEQNATARAQQGDPRGALPWFEHARQRGDLTPYGWLHYGNALAAHDPAAALALLPDARRHCATVPCWPYPFAVLAWLAEARWTRAAGQPVLVAETWLPQLATLVPAALVPELLRAFVREAGDPALDATLLPLHETAATAEALLARDGPAPTAPAPGPLPDTVLWPLDAGTLVVVPRALVIARRDDILRSATDAAPGWRLATAGAADDGDPSLVVPSLGSRWIARPTALPGSELLARAARTSLGLAALSLVLGNLLLWRLNRREAQLVKLRSDFVDVVSHELRTPLAALSLKAEMLARGDVPDTRRAHYLQGLHHDVRRLADQVERILDFGRLQHGAPLRPTHIAPRTLLARALRDVRPALRQVRQRLAVEAPRTLPALFGDVEVLGRALRNLLENATKYAPAGSAVGVRAHATGDRLVVEISDEGPGVPPDERDRIFQPFVRGRGAGADTAGSGLGLALVAAAVLRHGGEVAVHDRRGGGSVFTMSLPWSPESAS